MFVVVNGITYGRMWSDFTSVEGPLRPLGQTFWEWYYEWVMDKLHTLERELLLRQIRVGMSVESAKEILGRDVEQWGWGGSPLGSGDYVIRFRHTNATFVASVDHVIKEINIFDIL